MPEFNKQIKTRAWVHYVSSFVSVDNLGLYDSDRYGWILGYCDTSRVHLHERKTGVLAQNWSHYRTGERDVGQSTLKRVEQKIPGSLGVYRTGPDGAPLWSALWSDDELELWGIVKSISEIIQFHQAWRSDSESLYDYVRLESTKRYFAAMSGYFEGLMETTNQGLMDMENLVALVAAFRLGQFRREAATYQESIGRCLELSISEGSSVVNSLRGYGILDYFTKYIDKLIPHSEMNYTAMPLISRNSAVTHYLGRLNIRAKF